MATSEEKTTDKIRTKLEGYAYFNDGNGLILPPRLAQRLKELGIDGPYVVQEVVPSA